MKGSPYPTEMQEIRNTVERLSTTIGESEKYFMDNHFQKYVPLLSILRPNVNLATFEDIFKYSALFGRASGLQKSFQEVCVKTWMPLSPALRDLDIICMAEGAKGLRWEDDHAVISGVDIDSHPVNIHFKRPLGMLHRYAVGGRNLRRKTIVELNKCLAYWFDSVSDVLLTSIPTEKEPDPVTFRDEVERVYNESSEQNYLNFYFTNGKEGREVIAKRAGIMEGDVVIDVGSGSGWMIPHIARYKPSIIYTAETEYFSDLERMVKAMKDVEIKRVYDFYDFTKPVDVAVCSQAGFLGKDVVRKMAHLSRKGFVVGTGVQDPVEQYLGRSGVHSGAVAPVGRTPEISANSELKRLEKEALEYFKSVELSNYHGLFILSARDPKKVKLA